MPHCTLKHWLLEPKSNELFCSCGTIAVSERDNASKDLLVKATFCTASWSNVPWPPWNAKTSNAISPTGMGLKRVIAFANMDNTPRPFASLVAGLVNSMNWHLPLPKSRSSVKAHRSHLHLWLSQCQMVQLQMHRHTTNKVITCRVPSQPSNRTVQQRCCTVAKSELVIERWVWCHVMQVHQCRHMGKKTVVGCHEWVALRRTRKKNLKMFLDRHHFKSIVDISLLWKQSLWTKIWDFCCQQWNVSLASLFLFFVEPTESIEKAFEQTHVASVIQHFTQMQTLAQTRASLLQHVFEKLLEKRWAKSQCHPFSMSFRRFATWCQTFGQMFQGVLTQQSGSRFHNEHGRCDKHNLQKEELKPWTLLKTTKKFMTSPDSMTNFHSCE